MSSPEPRPLEPNAMRAGNEDREKVVAHLNSAFAEGRLDVSELDERVAAAYRAKTVGELVPLTADLPPQYAASPVRRPQAPQPPARPAAQHHEAARWAPVGGGLALFLVNVLIWAAVSIGTGDLVYFWPIWTAIPMVLAVVGVVVSGGHRDHR
jgi:Domain of unknown function (DUF1707)